MKTVSKEEFDAFLGAYPDALEMHLVTIAEPPLKMYYPLATGGALGTEAAAKVVLHSLRNGQPDEYQIAK